MDKNTRLKIAASLRAAATKLLANERSMIECPTCGAEHDNPDSAYCCDECRMDANRATQYYPKSKHQSIDYDEG
jgi:endogenous inhibitor of DNA gyrase (YacG/DUF329 family)